MGADPKTSVTNQLVPDLGREESVPHRRRAVRVERRQESDADDHGAGLALGRPHARAHAAEGAVMDRRTTIKWMLAAAASVPSLQSLACAARAACAPPSAAPTQRRATAPIRTWSRTVQARRAVAAHVHGGAAPDRGHALCDLIIPADEHSPERLGGRRDRLHRRVDQRAVPERAADRQIVLGGLRLAGSSEAKRASASRSPSASAGAAKRDLRRHLPSARRASRAFAKAAQFFARYRDLTAGGFYTTPRGPQGSPVRRQRAARELRRTAARSAEEGRPGVTSEFRCPP